jgi:crotonobetainyl-CoA:carnitine CoA-transferase CaiB-like acyl-CoA transferase
VWETTEYWSTGKSPKPLGTANRMSAPYQAFRGSDGYFVVGAANQRLWLRLCEVIDRPDLAADSRFDQNFHRVNHREVLAAELQTIFEKKPAQTWIDTFLDVGIPAAPINDYAEALNSDHARVRDVVIDIPHPVEGSFRALGFAAKLSETPARVNRPPPLLGEHNEEILAELGLADQSAELERAGAFAA